MKIDPFIWRWTVVPDYIEIKVSFRPLGLTRDFRRVKIQTASTGRMEWKWVVSTNDWKSYADGDIAYELDILVLSHEVLAEIAHHYGL